MLLRCSKYSIMEIRFQESSADSLLQYQQLYRACFPHAKHLSSEYLTWLYWKNPAGLAVGADAVCNGEVIGQVLAVPGKYRFRGREVAGLVAVNVAVHPNFQGRRLFKRLGLQMCEYGAARGYSFVIGVANAAATPGWTRQMGFQLVAPLEAKLGLGSIRLQDTLKSSEFKPELQHDWTAETLTWRAANPVNQLRYCSNMDSGIVTAYASAGKPGLVAIAEFPLDNKQIAQLNAKRSGTLFPRVFLGLVPNHHFGATYFSIPDKLKPSPLNLIFKNLQNADVKVDASNCFINFLDFDAF